MLQNNDYLCNQELYIDLTFTERLYLMNNTDVIKSLLEFAHGVTQAPELAQLLNVLYKSNTHSPQHISARSVDSAIECMEKLWHSGISRSNVYSNKEQREFDEKYSSMLAEFLKEYIKGYLKLRGLLDD